MTDFDRIVSTVSTTIMEAKTLVETFKLEIFILEWLMTLLGPERLLDHVSASSL